MKEPAKLLIGTNTKMTKTISQTVQFLKELDALTADISRDEMELFVWASYTALESARAAVDKKSILLGAQNMCWEDQGQFTGEISPLMLKEIGMDIIEIGHSERRHVLHENDLEINKKVLAALKHGFTALLCVGETQEQKALNLSDEALATQLKTNLKDVGGKDTGKLWIAYEPVWAIGVNGIPATAEYADEKQSVIRSVLKELFGRDCAVPVLYGGSVNPQNAVELIRMPHIGGLFVGRSAWDAKDFNALIRQVLPLFKKKTA